MIFLLIVIFITLVMIISDYIYISITIITNLIYLLDVSIFLFFILIPNSISIFMIITHIYSYHLLMSNVIALDSNKISF